VNLACRTSLYQSSDAPEAGSLWNQSYFCHEKAMVTNVLHKSAELMGSKTVPWTALTAATARSPNAFYSTNQILIS